MRAPPDALTETSGTPCSTALSQARANFSPTALPIEPPMKAKSITASSQALPSTVARPITIASPSPVPSSASARRSPYGRRSKKSSGSSERRSAASSVKLPSSARLRIRARARIGKWCPQCEQTQRFSSSSSSRKCDWHFGQVFGCFFASAGGASFVSTWTSIPGSAMTRC